MGDLSVVQRLGVDDGRILIRAHPCDSQELVRSVALRVATGKPGVEGETIWKITSEAGALRRDYEVGQTPADFVETVPLGDIQQDNRYLAVITRASGGLDFLTAFVPSSLKPSNWETSTYEYLTNEQFDNLRPCD